MERNDKVNAVNYIEENMFSSNWLVTLRDDDMCQGEGVKEKKTKEQDSAGLGVMPGDIVLRMERNDLALLAEAGPSLFALDLDPAEVGRLPDFDSAEVGLLLDFDLAEAGDQAQQSNSRTGLTREAIKRRHTDTGLSTPTHRRKWEVDDCTAVRNNVAAPRMDVESEWNVVQNKRQKRITMAKDESQRFPKILNKGKTWENRNNTPRSHTEAVLIKPENVATLREKINPAETEMEIKAIRKTNDGGVLLQLGHKTKNKREFGNLKQKVLGPNHVVRDLKPRMMLEIRDLDCTTTEAEVRDAIPREMEEPLKDNFKVAIFEPNNRGQKWL
ncbi:hypothetical protein J437_LFUL002850 [Ladona fulva]|uniref:Uncharacterized protein n=1 Tax=Ladona fulva TaxID=123851 RepID=A0A8K0P0M5_LADFU|nr:hypothetical protein J437_LFUL002850 [Ladona fulva]